MIWRQLRWRSTHTNAMCCAASLANTCASCLANLHRKCASTSSACICCRERLRNLHTLKMRLAGASIGASRQRGDHYLLLKVGRDAPLGATHRCARRAGMPVAGDRNLYTIACGSKGANCAAGDLSFRRDSPLKYVRGELHNPGDSPKLTTVKHRDKSVCCGAKSWHIRRLPDEAVYLSRGGSALVDLLLNKSLFWLG